MRGTPEYAALLPNFEDVPGARQIVRLTFDLVQTSWDLACPCSTTRRNEVASFVTGLPRAWTPP